MFHQKDLKSFLTTVGQFWAIIRSLLYVILNLQEIHIPLVHVNVILNLQEIHIPLVHVNVILNLQEIHIPLVHVNVILNLQEIHIPLAPTPRGDTCCCRLYTRGKNWGKTGQKLGQKSGKLQKLADQTA